MVRALRIYKEVVCRRSQAQAVEPAKRVDDGEDDDRAEVRGGVVLVEARRDLADVEPAHLARAQHVLDERQHDLGVKAERLRCADAWMKPQKLADQYAFLTWKGLSMLRYVRGNTYE